MNNEWIQQDPEARREAEKYDNPIPSRELILQLLVQGHRDGFGFLVPDEGTEDLFLGPSQMRLVFDGDRVLGRVTGVDRRGRSEGAVVEVLERAHEILVGRYYEENGISFVVADNAKINQDVLIPPGANMGAKHGQYAEGRGN